MIDTIDVTDIDVTYNARTMDGDVYETFALLAVSKAAYAALTGKDDDRDAQENANRWLEKAITAIAALRGLEYVPGSIKDVRMSL